MVIRVGLGLHLSRDMKMHPEELYAISGLWVTAIRFGQQP